MQDFEKDVIDAIIKGKPGKGNVEKADPTDTITKELTPTDHIVMVVDRSGSMGSIREDAEGGVNGFIEENKKVGKAIFTMVEFDSEYDVIYDKADLQTVERYNLRPRGMTALMDAIGIAFSGAEDVQIDGSKIAVIVTDGGENASQEWNKEKIFNRIDELKKKGWDFIFLAANQDALESGGGYGFDSGTTLNFDRNTVGDTYKVASAYAVSHRSMRGSGLKAKKAYASSVMDEMVANNESLSTINTHKSGDVQVKIEPENQVTIEPTDINLTMGQETFDKIFKNDESGVESGVEFVVSNDTDSLVNSWTSDVVDASTIIDSSDSIGFTIENLQNYADQLKETEKGK
jgi:hypothetical protein